MSARKKRARGPLPHEQRDKDNGNDRYSQFERREGWEDSISPMRSSAR